MEHSIFIYNEDYRIRSYETDINARATIQTILNYMQNSGFNHALQLNKAGGLTPDPDIAYFLTRQRARVLRYPDWKEQVSLVSWLEPRFEKYAVREFEILDSGGNIIICATNSALFYNVKEKRVIPASECMHGIPVPSRERALDDPFNPIPKISRAHFSRDFTARLADLDMYRHVNNVVYVEWAVETIPDEVWDRWMLRDHEINFRSEVSLGETVISEAEEVSDGDNRVFIHRISKKSDGRDVALLRTWWDKR